MKLRIKGNSLRLRVSRVDMAALVEQGSIEETIQFGAAPEARLSYALRHEKAERDIRVEYAGQRVSVVLSTEAALRWASNESVGIYGSAEVGDGLLELMVEKDFACLDGADAVDEDAFPNPNAGVVC
jgi:hypothetical protein